MQAKLRNRVKRFNKHLKSGHQVQIWSVLSLYSTHHPELQLEERGLPSILKGRDVPRLLELADSLRRTEYASAAMHYAANQFAELVRKYPFSDPSLDPEQKAFDTFISAEARCRRYNRLSRLRVQFGRNKFEAFYSKVRSHIRYIIGERPDHQWIDLCGFGPGANVGIHGASTHPGAKLQGTWTCSASAVHYFLAACRRNLFMRRALWPAHEGFLPGVFRTVDEDLAILSKSGKMEIVDYNKLEFVPKTATTHRSIAIEPLGNSFTQKGIDTYMRQRLKRIGIDLSDQLENSRMARLGSILPETPFATIDLSSASDSISIGLARDVLPREWFEFLNALRSKHFVYRSEKSRYEKFCSMGNGFCFPLQTLIFTAICLAADCGRPGKDFRVYGDDIVVPSCRATTVCTWLKRFGLKINLDKTYIEGPFRESCGGDWFDGQDVRPYVFDNALDSLERMFGFCNAVGRNPLWGRALGPVRDYVLARIPVELRLYRPFPGSVDTALDSDGVEHLTSPFCRYEGNGVWRWTELLNSAKPDVRFADIGSLEFPLQMYNAHIPGAFVLRRMTRTRISLTRGAGATSQWCPTGVVRRPVNSSGS